MASVDPELRRLEKILLKARVRLDRITWSFSDPTVLKAAEDLCAKAAAAVAAHKSKI